MVLTSQVECTCVAAGQVPLVVLRNAAVNLRADSVNDVLHVAHVAGAGDDGIASRAPVSVAFSNLPPQRIGAGRFEDGFANAAAFEQVLVRGIDNRVSEELCDVGLHERDLAIGF